MPDNILYGLFETAPVLYAKQAAAGLAGVRVNSAVVTVDGIWYATHPREMTP